MKKKLIQINVAHKVDEKEVKPTLSLSLISIDSPVKEINSKKNFTKYFFEFIKHNKDKYNDYYALQLTYKKKPIDELEVTYYFVPESIRHNLLNYKIVIPFAKKIFNSKESDIIDIAEQIFLYLEASINAIKIDNGDKISNISLLEFNRL